MGDIQIAHSLSLDQRKKLTMTGVTEVLRFEDTAVVLQTELGTLTVLGQDLRLKTLSTEGGQMAVTGEVSALTMKNPAPPVAGCAASSDDAAGNCRRPIRGSLSAGAGTGPLVQFPSSLTPPSPDIRRPALPPCRPGVLALPDLRLLPGGSAAGLHPGPSDRMHGGKSDHWRAASSGFHDFLEVFGHPAEKNFGNRKNFVCIW